MWRVTKAPAQYAQRKAAQRDELLRDRDHLRSVFPFRGAVAILGAFLGAAAAIIVLLIARDRPVANWTISLDEWTSNSVSRLLWAKAGSKVNGASVAPSVFISIVMVWIGLCIQMAHTDGLSVWWWRQASKQLEAEHLHADWAVGGSSVAAIQSLRPERFSFLPVSTICVAALSAAGPLLQKSIGTKSEAFHFDGQRTVEMIPISKVIPLDYPTALLDSTGGLTDIMPFEFANTISINAALNGMTINVGSGCVGTCYANITGAGFTTSCESTEVEYDLDPASVSNATEQLLLGATFNLTSANEIEVTTVTKTDAACSGKLVKQTCTLTAAAVEYSVIIGADADASLYSSSWNVTLATHGSTTEEYTGRKAAADIAYPDTDNQTGTYPSYMGGIYLKLLNEFDFSFSGKVSNSTYIASVTGDSSFLSIYQPRTGSDMSQYYTYGNWEVFEALVKNCTITFTGLMDQILQDADSLFFATALRSGYLQSAGVIGYFGTADYTYPDDVTAKLATEWNQTVTADEYSDVQLYTTNIGFLIGGIVVICIANSACLALFWRFYTLDAKRTMSPLETAAVVTLQQREGGESFVPVQDGYRVQKPEAAAVVEVKTVNGNDL